GPAAGAGAAARPARRRPRRPGRGRAGVRAGRDRQDPAGRGGPRPVPGRRRARGVHRRPGGAAAVAVEPGAGRGAPGRRCSGARPVAVRRRDR
ncbi:MAG: hypothetical protein AVDCRST_MAG41-1996, partial [uncultured Corynebacteriales bacterium]